MDAQVDIYIATHKSVKFDMPDGYHWVQVNSAATAKWDGYLHDDDGEDNISSKNSSYCELTALYRLWKESKADYVGLCHYRRYFGDGLLPTLFERAGIQVKKDRINSLILKPDRVDHLLKGKDILLALPYCPFPLNVYEDLLRFVFPSDIECMISTIQEHFPEYEADLWRTLKSKSISYCNMFVARREITNAYCSWLFAVLARIERRIDITSYDSSHARVFGYLAEVLLNVYVSHHHLAAQYAPLVTLDEDDTPTSWKRSAVLSWRLIQMSFSITPNRWNRSLWESRYRFLCEKTEPYPDCMLNPRTKLFDYFSSVGGSDIISKDTPFVYVRSHFGSSSIHAFWCNRNTDAAALFERIEEVSHTNTSFGLSNNIRIYVSESVISSSKNPFLNDSFFFVEDDCFKYYCFKGHLNS